MAARQRLGSPTPADRAAAEALLQEIYWRPNAGDGVRDLVAGLLAELRKVDEYEGREAAAQAGEDARGAPDRPGGTLEELRARAHSGHWNDDDMLRMIADLGADLSAAQEQVARLERQVAGLKRNNELLSADAARLNDEREHYRGVVIPELRTALAGAEARLEKHEGPLIKCNCGLVYKCREYREELEEKLNLAHAAGAQLRAKLERAQEWIWALLSPGWLDSSPASVRTAAQTLERIIVDALTADPGPWLAAHDAELRVAVVEECARVAETSYRREDNRLDIGWDAESAKRRRTQRIAAAIRALTKGAGDA